jgi:hypothetical protein
MLGSPTIPGTRDAEPVALPGRPALDVDRARRVAERLRSEFGTILRALPPECRTIVGVAEELQIPRPGCQRLLRALRSRGSVVESLTFYPGVRGLQQIVNAARRRGLDDSIVAGAEAAVRQFADLTIDCGGSQSRLNFAVAAALLECEAAPADSGPELAKRHRAFAGWRHVTRRSFETQLAVYIYRPVKGNEALIHSVTAMGMIGINRDASALPLCVASSSTPSDETHSHTVESLPGLSGLPISIMPDFSSSPPPEMTVRRQPGRVTVMMDPLPGEATDVVLARRFTEITHPAFEEPRQQFCWLLSEGPSRNLLMQVYMHRSMARASIPTADAYFVGSRGVVGGSQPDANGEMQVETPAFRWFDRLPDGPRLEQLGSGIGRSDHASYPRSGELCAELFRRHAWDPDEFVGVQCHVRYPVWGAQYLISFDFSSDDPDAVD